jgi:hypothetical protein
MATCTTKRPRTPTACGYDKEAAHPDAARRRRPGEGLHLGQVLRTRRARMAAHLQAARPLAAATGSRSCRRTARTSSSPSWRSGSAASPRWRSSPPRAPTPSATCSSTAIAKLLFVGKLDTWPQQAPGVPAACRASPSRSRRPPRSRPGTRSSPAPNPSPVDRPRRRRPRDADLHLRLHRPAQGRDAQLRAGHARSEGIVKASASPRRTGALVPAARARLRARLHRVLLVRRRRPRVLRRNARDLRADLKRARPTLFISVPRLWLKFQQGVFAKMPPEEARLPAQDPDPRQHRRARRC